MLTLLEGRGNVDTLVKAIDRSYARFFGEMTYADLLRRCKAPNGCFIFADIDRMTASQRQVVCCIYDRLMQNDPPPLILNNPHRQKARFELLRSLYEAGINQYRVFRIDEVEAEMRFPVFVRLANDHNGPQTFLLHDREAVRAAIATQLLRGSPPEQLMIIEYQDTSDESGDFKKYGAQRIGDLQNGQHIYLGNNWIGKRSTSYNSDEMLAMSNEYAATDPHHDLARSIFDFAGMEFGRVDYGFTDGKIQVWEVNDNPQWLATVDSPYKHEPRHGRTLSMIRELNARSTQTGQVSLAGIEETLKTL